MKPFRKGQTVVHLSHGLGIITGIEAREFSPNNVEKFYIITIEDNGAHKKVFVPFKNAETRLRPIMDKSAAVNVLAYIALGETTINAHSTWSRRYRDYMERLHTGQARQIAEVYVALRNTVDLSFGERKLLDLAKQLLVKEFEAVGIALPE